MNCANITGRNDGLEAEASFLLLFCCMVGRQRYSLRSLKGEKRGVWSVTLHPCACKVVRASLPAVSLSRYEYIWLWLLRNGNALFRWATESRTIKLRLVVVVFLIVR